MNLRTEKAAVDAAEMNVLFGLIAAAAIASLRALALYDILVAAGPIDLFLLVQHAVAFVLVLALAYGVYHHWPAAAIGLLVVWGLGYFHSWYLLGRLLPPLGVIGLLIWFGLYRGLRGTHFLARRRQAAVDAGAPRISAEGSPAVRAPQPP
jgi:hypothetical protein